MADRPEYVRHPSLHGMSIEELARILPLFYSLSETAVGFAERGNFEDTAAGVIADAIWSDCLAVYDESIDQLRETTPKGQEEIEQRARLLLEHSAGFETFAALSLLAREAAENSADTGGRRHQAG